MINRFFSLQHRPDAGITVEAIAAGAAAAAVIDTLSRWRPIRRVAGSGPDEHHRDGPG